MWETELALKILEAPRGPSQGWKQKIQYIRMYLVICNISLAVTGNNTGEPKEQDEMSHTKMGMSSLSNCSR